jgi:hypothetical protein
MIPKGMPNEEFGLNYKGDDIAGVDPILAKIKSLDPKLDRLERAESLEIVLQLIAKSEEPKQAAYLDEIQAHFGLLKAELEPFTKQVKRLSRELRKSSGVKDQNEKYTALGENIVDLAEQAGLVVFLVLEEGELSIRASVQKDGVVCLPPPMESIPWLLPPAERVVTQYELDRSRPQPEVDRKLFEDIMTALKGVSELPSEKHYIFAAGWVMHTYHLEKHHYSPIICLYAVHERGKSRTGKALVYLSYRGIHVESLREAYILRMAEYFGATIFVDVIDVWKKANDSGSQDVLMARFERGVKVPRVLYPDKGEFKDIKLFSIFGPTILGTNEPIDQTLDSRAIEINMPLSSRSFDNEVKPEDFLELKVRLISFRARHLGTEETEQTEGSKPARGRLGDIAKPILQTIEVAAPEYGDDFKEFIGDHENARVAEKSQTLEALLIQSVYRLEAGVFNGKLPIKTITIDINQDRQERLRFNPQTIGRKLTALGFKKGRMTDGSMAIVYDTDFIGKLLEGYGLSNPSVCSDPSGDRGKSEDTEGTEGILGLL